MLFKAHRALLFAVLIISSILLVHMSRAAAAATISIPITIRGLSPQLSTTVIVDGKEEGTVPGGGSKSFNVDKSRAHTFQVEAEIKGACISYEGREVCSRFVSPNNVWTLDVISTQNCQQVPVCYDYYYYCDHYGYCWYEPYCTYEQQCWTTTQLSEKGHTFDYHVEHEVVVVNPHGQNTDSWESVDSDLALSADEFVIRRDESSVKERDVFVHWLVNGVPMEDRMLTLKVDQPLYVRAEYRTETQFRVRVISDFGNPTIDKPDGWYYKGEEVTVSVEKEVASDGWMGALGGKNVFVAWRSPRGVESREPTFFFAVQEPVTLQAEWRADNSQPTTVIAAVGIVVVAALVILALYRSRRLSKPKAMTEQTELEQARAEIASLRERLEKKTESENPE